MQPFRLPPRRLPAHLQAGSTPGVAKARPSCGRTERGVGRTDQSHLGAGKRFGAILGVVGAVDIPLIHMSVQWFRSQHPQPVVMKPEGPTAAPEIIQTLLVSLLAFTLLFFSLLLARYLVARLQERVDAMRFGATLRPGTSASQGVTV